ncbi:thiamine-phosphate kinase [Thalassotalea piscium]|uniref:Thiamine-monophosphate kinase n=1 Tax=Thalassotalea piscium TaxID=1230533 RepID=A0A7X0NG60_9GAMM|nr:thiamine-phosphate kinase [Thalassotalea piscium]MBB6542738.1 thiamine-monophosphate kinase [Thalassotalea piscium]
MKEFELIKNYFTEQAVKRKDVLLGVGDDCAVVIPSEKQNIAVATDTLVAGVHFPVNTSPRAIGHKAIAVNLSDLAAIGAEPSWVSVAITLPQIDEHWVDEFCTGLFDLCEYYNVQVIGGDTTQGPLSITVTAQGLIPVGQELLRTGARSGDWVYVTGELGDAALALAHILGKKELDKTIFDKVRQRLDFPTPRVLAGQALRSYASSAIDISDGLMADLTHMCRSSKVGANLVLENLPLSESLVAALGQEKAIEMALAGGDDYELLFAVSEDKKVGLEIALADTGVKFTCIGQLNPSEKITTTLNSKPAAIKVKGFEHFSKND